MKGVGRLESKRTRLEKPTFLGAALARSRSGRSNVKKLSYSNNLSVLNPDPFPDQCVDLVV
jgi:hypothetical protein